MGIAMQQQLAGLLDLAEHMQAGAAAGRWDEVSELRDRFQQGAESLFSGNFCDDELAELRDIIRRVSAINCDVIALCRDARDEQGREMEKLRQGQRAVSSYSAHAR